MLTRAEQLNPSSEMRRKKVFALLHHWRKSEFLRIEFLRQIVLKKKDCML